MISNVIMWRGRIHKMGDVRQVPCMRWSNSRTMPCLKRMTNPKFCYHSCCLKTSCNMQHVVDNLLVSVLETMTFYRGANLIFSSQFSDMCSVVHLTVLTVSAIMFWDFVPFSLSKLHQLEAFSMTFSLKHLEFCLFTIHGIWVIKDCSSISKLGNFERYWSLHDFILFSCRTPF
jgi:hypothetical protein